MASPRTRQRLTPQEYLEIERKAERKSEYFGGEMFAMAGASPEHNLIAANIIVVLGTHLWKRPCRVRGSDQRIAVEESGLYTYADVVVTCGEDLFAGEGNDTIVNPLVVVEVLSPSTEAYDRGVKFDHYRKLTSLQEYLLVARDEAKVQLFTRQPYDRWLMETASGLDGAIELGSIDCRLRLAEVYEKVELPEHPPRPSPPAEASH